jgi:hypothetical protein
VDIAPIVYQNASRADQYTGYVTIVEQNIRPDPKPKRIKLTGKKYTEFRRELCHQANSTCETCGEYAPLLWNGVFDEYWCGHVSHIRSRGAGGNDDFENCKWQCFDCHRAKHDGMS